ncbi:MAG: flagellar hook-basal body complex protein FliE [Oscillospiraceae bacterium]|nr:flagellar hook-basal body complex protein FliE [Oscillospiraceae bacterium]
MNTIQPLWEQMPLQGIRPEQTAETPDKSGGAFTDIFQSAIDAVKETDAEKTQMEYLMATGQLDNPALLTIASTKAQLSVDLLVQLRNKSMDAYNELMRISL